MSAGTVLDVLARLKDAGADVWIAGGWGVDALLGRQTREHADLDLVHDARHESAALKALAAAAYRETLDLRPVRFVLRDGRTELDLHPLHFAPDGSATQSAGEDGAVFRYPATCFVTGRIGDAVVPCLSVAQQVMFHQGYEPRPHDVADMRALSAAFDVDTTY